MFILKNSKSISILKKQQPQIEIRLMRNRCIFWPNQPTNQQANVFRINKNINKNHF